LVREISVFELLSVRITPPKNNSMQHHYELTFISPEKDFWFFVKFGGTSSIVNK